MKFAALLALTALAPAAELEIRGTVVDAITNQPIHRARVALSFWTDAAHVHRRAMSLFSGEDGSFRFTAVPEGEFELEAFKAGYIDGLKARIPSIRLRSGAEDEFTLRLAPAGDLIVSIRDDRGNPVAGAQARIHGTPAAGAFFALPFVETVDSAGQCVFVVPAGRYRVTAAGPGEATLLRARGFTFTPASTLEYIEVAAGTSVQTEIRVKPIPARTVHLKIETPEGAGQFLLLHSPGELDDYRIRWGLMPYQPGARSVDITGLAPGAYRLIMNNYEKSFQIGDNDLHLAITPADRKY